MTIQRFFQWMLCGLMWGLMPLFVLSFGYALVCFQFLGTLPGVDLLIIVAGWTGLWSLITALAYFVFQVLPRRHIKEMHALQQRGTYSSVNQTNKSSDAYHLNNKNSDGSIL